MTADRAAEDRLLESVADGAAIDWAAAETHAVGELERRRVRNLRLVARVAALHRSLREDDLQATLAELPEREAYPDPVVWGHLEVRERLGGGAFGTLYRARDPQLDRDVALKLLRPGVSALPEGMRLLSEARTLARVRHPNVVVVHGADIREGRAGLWMELIDGQTLETRIGERGTLDRDEVVSIGRDLCGALTAVHEANLVHGDVKAQNVMRESTGRTVLMDFGAGRAQGTESPTAGTPLYLAPEVLAGEPATAQSDIYSLGVLLFHLLTGTYPYAASDMDALRQVHAAGTRASLRDLRPDLPGRLVQCVERALDRDPAARFESAAAMDRALGDAARLSARARVVIIGAVAVAAAIVIAIVLPGLRGSRGLPVRSVALVSFTTPRAELAHVVGGLSKDVLRQLQRFDVQVKRIDSPAGQPVESLFDSIDTEAMVDGQVTGDGRRLRIAILHAGPSERWSREYSLADSVVPRLASMIAADVMKELGVAIRSDALPPPHQPNYRAYEAYLRGRALADERTQDSLARSLEYFKQAADLDPNFAEPHAGMADAYLTLGVPPFGKMHPSEAQRLARAAADRALAINENLVEAHTSLAFAALLYEYDWAGAEEKFQKALSINPHYAVAHHWYSMFLTDMGRFEDARHELQLALAVEPLSVLFHRDVAWIDICERKYDDAIRRLEQTLKMDATFTPTLTLLSRALAATGDYDRAFQLLENARPRIPRGSYLSFRAHTEALAGMARARDTLAELRQVATQEYVSPYYLAMVLAALGNTDAAVEQLQRAYEDHDPTLGTMNVDPRFDPIRSAPGFQALVRRLKYPAPIP